MTAQNTPESWASFNQFLKSLDEPCREKVRGSFPRFQARYRAARSMEITFDGYATEDTPAGYVAILKCGMAYSVLESLEKSIGASSCIPGPIYCQEVRVESSKLANYFREAGSKQLRNALSKHLKKASLREKIKDLESSGNDVRPLAEGIRHLAFHGISTPGTIGYRRKGKNASVAELLDELPGVVLDATDSHFTRWCMRIKGCM